MAFTNRTFDLLTQLETSGRYSFYKRYEADFKVHLVAPFRELILEGVTPNLPQDIAKAMETTQRIFGQIHKNDYGKGGAYPYYWAALYPKDTESKSKDVQLLVFIERNYLEFGFFLGWYTPEKRARQLRDNCKILCRSQEHFDGLANYLEENLPESSIARRSQEYQGEYYDLSTYNSLSKKGPAFTWRKFLQALSNANHETIASYSPMIVLPKEVVIRMPTSEMRSRIRNAFVSLFPLVLLATSTDPLSTIQIYTAKHA